MNKTTKVSATTKGFDELHKQNPDKYVAVVTRLAKAKYTGTLFTPQGGSFGIGSYPSFQAALNSATGRLSNDVISFVKSHQGGKIPVFYGEFDYDEEDYVMTSKTPVYVQ